VRWAADKHEVGANTRGCFTDEIAFEKELNSRRIASTSVHAEKILFDAFLDSR
jgi:hypothetical protein